MLSLQSACKFEMILKQKTNKQTNYSISWHENTEHLKPLGYFSFISEGTVLSLYFIQLYQNMNKTKFPSMKCLPPPSIELLWGDSFICILYLGGGICLLLQMCGGQRTTLRQSLSRFYHAVCSRLVAWELAGECPIPVSHLATGNAVVTDARHSLRIFVSRDPAQMSRLALVAC